MVTLGLLFAVTLISTTIFKHGIQTQLHISQTQSGLHFLDSLRATARQTGMTQSFSPAELSELFEFQNTHFSNINGVGFTDTGTTQYPTTISFPSEKSISIPVGIGKLNLK